MDKNGSGQAYVNRDGKIYLSGALDTNKGSFAVSARPAGHSGWPLGSRVTVAARPKSGYRYRSGTIKVTSYNTNADLTSALAQVPGEDKWTLSIPDDIVLYAEFEDARAAQTVSDPSHAEGAGYIYVIVAGEDDRVPLEMVNSTVFGPGDTAPDPLLSFALADPDGGVVRLEGNAIIPLKTGVAIVNATAAETASHMALNQPIAVKVVRPLSVALTARDYTQAVGFTFVPSYTDGSEAPYTLDGATRYLGLRKAGEAALAEIAPASWQWDAPYTQAFAALEADTEYELVLRANDHRSPSIAAEAVLRFRTPSAGSVNTGGIEGTVDGSGTIAVRVERGNTVIAEKGGFHANDRFSFTNLPDGFYNLVASNGVYTVTVMVEVKNGGTAQLNVVYVGQQESTVKVASGAPPVAADRLGELFREPIYTANAEATDAVDEGGSVEIRLTAASPDDLGADKIPVDAIADHAEAGKQTVGLLVNLTMDMIITPRDALSRTLPITEAGALVEIALPLPPALQGKDAYQALRYHGGGVDVLPEIEPGSVPSAESFYVSGAFAHIFAMKFSTYAITVPKTDEFFTITAAAHEGGAITPSGTVQVARHGDASFTVTPYAGWRVQKVLMNGSLAVLSPDNRYAFYNVTAPCAIEAYFCQTDAAPPQTGDSTAVGTLICLGVLAVAGMARLAVSRKSRRKKESRAKD